MGVRICSDMHHETCQKVPPPPSPHRNMEINHNICFVDTCPIAHEASRLNELLCRCVDMFINTLGGRGEGSLPVHNYVPLCVCVWGGGGCKSNETDNVDPYANPMDQKLLPVCLSERVIELALKRRWGSIMHT